MKQVRTKGIVLARTNFGEADRIITFLTPDHGKVKVMAKAVRKSKSKLAGGIELFSVSDITYVLGRGEIGTLTSTRLVCHYGNIVKEIERTNTGYEFIKTLDKATELQTETAYFTLMDDCFGSLDAALEPQLVRFWFYCQLLKLAGNMINTTTDIHGEKLSAAKTYDFNNGEMGFVAGGREGSFNSSHIKLLRLGFSSSQPQIFGRIDDASRLISQLLPVLRAAMQAVI